MMNSDGMGGVPFDGVPLGFGMGLAMNEKALEGYAKMSEAEKEEILNRSRDAKSKAEMEKIVNSIREDDEVRNVLEHGDFGL